MRRVLVAQATLGLVAGAAACASAEPQVSHPTVTVEIPVATGAAPPRVMLPTRAVGPVTPDRSCCAGRNSCKGQNECKGKGSCKTDRHECKGKNECKGLGGCKAEC